MKRALTLLFSSLGILTVLALAAERLTVDQIRSPSPDSWPTFNGDYTGRHFSPLKEINQSNVKSLSLAWTIRLVPGQAGAIVGGEGPEPAQGGVVPATGYATRGDIKGTPLLVNGVLYISMLDNAWAVDARTGQEIWHYFWKTRGGSHVGNRGMAMYGNWLYFETPDDYLVSIDASTGKERWHKTMADVRLSYFSGAAPLVAGNHLIVGVGGDGLDLPAYVESRDLETGEPQWRFNVDPQPGDPALKTWPDAFSAERGGGMPWLSPTYDPELNLIYVPTGNPQPVIIGDSRPGDNLYTASIVALNPDTGKLVWYFQCSPHDTHDWDATQTPVLFDATINGQPRKLIAQASRNGMFFTLDRVTGKNIVSAQFIESGNAFKGFRPDGSPIPNPMKEAQVGGAIVSPNNGGAANWANPSYDPQTGLFYVNAVQGFEIVYRDGPGVEKVAGTGGASQHAIGGLGEALEAIDPLTGKVKWKHTYPGTEVSGPRPEASGGLLTTAGGLLFGGGPSGHIVAYDPGNGKILWHSGLQSTLANAPITYMLDGRQYLTVASGDTIYAFSLQE